MTNKENKPILKCWVARNLNGTLGLSTEKPLRLINLGVWGVKYPGLPGHTVSMFSIDDSLFPELSWKDEAKQISLSAQTEKPTNQEGLEEEITSFFMSNRVINHSEIGLRQYVEMVARHFAQWGSEQFAKIIRANLTQFDKNVQSQFEHLYMEITKSKMYGGYKD